MQAFGRDLQATSEAITSCLILFLCGMIAVGAEMEAAAVAQSEQDMGVWEWRFCGKGKES